ncbi:MAG: HD domain-containing protein [Chitinispirillaceae bacterium]|nr:HD domain-containing protein [Chitinispirillaceae bacterium]
MPVISINDLIEGHVTEADYYSSKGQLLIARGEVITGQHLTLLRRRNIFEIHLHYQETRGTPPLPLVKISGGIVADAPSPVDGVLPAAEQSSLGKWQFKEGREGYEQLLTNRSLDGLDRALKLKRISDRPLGRAFCFSMRQQFLFHRPITYKAGIAQIYADSLDKIKIILNRLVGGMTVDTGKIRSLVERFVDPFLNDRNILLCIASQKVDRYDPLYNHALNVCLLSMNLAAAADYSEEQVILIGMGALLHDIGMLLIPQSIRFKEGRLNEEEWYEIRKHPLFGLHIIDRMLHIPDATKYITYQIHERENGKGYPKQRSGHLIHNFAKIAQIADIFDAVSSPRPYRPAYTPYKGVEMLIKMGKQKLISEAYVNTMLKSVSLFPVGSMVELSDGRIAQVIAANEYHLARPLVSVVAERNGVLLDQSHTYTLDLAVDATIQVIKSLPFDAMVDDALYGF